MSNIRIRHDDSTADKVQPPTVNYNYGETGGWCFAYQTKKDLNPARDLNHPTPDDPNSRPWLAFVLKPVGKGARNGNPKEHTIVRSQWFASRASARKAAQRWFDSYGRRVERQTQRRLSGYIPPSQLCPKCEDNKKLKDYYLCGDCC